MSDTLLEIRELSTWLVSNDEIVRAIDSLSLTIERGETYALLGESGCGKSMTALSVMRLLPDAGQVVGGEVNLGGEDLLAKPEIAMRDIRGRRVAMIFQEPMLSLNPVMPIGAQIAETLQRHTDLTGEGLDARVLELLNAVGIPDPARRRTEYPFQLSGGMKQRVMIAIALACGPELLIADEPTTALDVTIQAQILDLLRELQKKTGMSVLLITHDLAVVAEMAQRVAVMYAGQIVETAPREQFFRRPAHPYSRKLFDSLPTQHKRGDTLAVIRGSVPPLTREFKCCRFADRCDYAWDLCRTVVPPWYSLGDGQGVRCHLYAPGAKRETGPEQGGEQSQDLQATVVLSRNDLAPVPVAALGSEPLLQVEDLKVHFPIRSGILQRVTAHVKAVDGVSFSIGAGRTLGLVGESGCGKTTVGKGLLRLVEPTGGRVLFAGEDMARLTRAEMRAKRSEVQIIFQDPYASLNPRMRVAEILDEGMAALGIGQHAADRSRRIDSLLDEVGLAPEMKLRYPHEFSGGQRQRIAIARALSVEPRLIVCDEPTSALDVSVQAQILNLLKSLQTSKGLAYLFITHNISVVEYLAHEVAVMYLGRIVEAGAVDEVLKSPQHPYTRALLAAVPTIDPATRREFIRLKGDLPSPVNPPAGCYFNPRCKEALPECATTYPDKTPLTATRSVSCHLYKK
jgi:peptide/nickel transport system ATP-binding protein